MMPAQITAVRAVSAIILHNVAVPDDLLTHHAREALRVFKLLNHTPISPVELVKRYEATYGESLASSEKLSRYKIGLLLSQLVQSGSPLEKKEGLWHLLK